MALPAAERFAALLATVATERGLIGPREVPRLWERHLVNCALLSELVAADATVADVGSGAGLPGVVLALRRPDVRVTLIEPLLRRSVFLEEVAAELELTHVEVIRARAEDVRDREFDVVTSRAVAPLDRLARWSMPLVRGGGWFLPMKGSSAATELADAEGVLRRLGARSWSVEVLGEGVLDPPTRIVRVRKVGGGRP